MFAIKTGIKPGLATKMIIAELIVSITLTLVNYPAGRSGWVSPCFLALSLWLVSLFCRWPIPDSICDGESCGCGR